MNKPLVLIPVYKPDQQILSHIIEQVRRFDIAGILLVNDGSGPEYDAVFAYLTAAYEITLLEHGRNLGKGAALRTGFAHINQHNVLCSHVITMDADGQHLPRDVKKVMADAIKHPEALVLGVREFKGKIPFRSRLGNTATYLIFRGLVGQTVTDTQTGLRAVPVGRLDQLIRLSSDRYAYELEMLLTLIQDSVTVREVPITTVYENNNSTSSFRPISDSILIYKTLLLWWLAFRFKQMLKYSLSGIFSTIADFGAYILLIHFSVGFVGASILARFLSVLIHFSANKYFTFSYRDAPNFAEIGKYIMVAIFNLSASILLIFIFIRYFFMGEVVAKVAAQLILFFLTYALLNGFVFLRAKNKA
ncbi:MAG: bifunctional glycosyltransferase family 2/GtrA family protein [Proteobacteria bacterium]|nr:glycosyltransferase [Desulfobacula sp.]MBU3951123.1 bifunctional glycosyltransferase family 2/GtrA family protein [Pseudomonadota bacterium]MBU4130191.1 bifunctional glycosyltransferase family 2/GtrA family protein [Pseudomonadota bacterium]